MGAEFEFEFVIVVDEFEFCADTINPVLATIAARARSGMKR